MIIQPKIESENNWELCKTRVFWGEIAPYDHVVQIYEDKEIFMDTLVGFVGNGINSGDCVVVIAKSENLQALNQQLKAHAIRVDTLISEDQYIPLDAEEVLSGFMVNDWPDESLFLRFVYSIIERARAKNRELKAFGEMVAMLWEQGHYGATVHLEHLWNKICAQEPFCLFCAYPKSGFTQDPNESIKKICATHSRVIAGDKRASSQIAYRTVTA
jgi:hypothetical protein